MCGILGIFSDKPVASQMYDGLIHLQHRGQDAAGILTYDDHFRLRKGLGFVRDVFNNQNMLELTGKCGIAHTRYATSADARITPESTQPLMLFAPYGISMVHNGDLTNYFELKEKLEKKESCYFNSTSDLEVILHVFAKEMYAQSDDENNIFENICNAVEKVFKRCRGGYSVISIIAGKGMVAFRDPHGIRPFVRGERKNKDGSFDYIFSSENTMYYPLGFKMKGDVEPGEVIFIDKNGKKQNRIIKQEMFTPDIFEYVYLARPDSLLNHVSVYRARSRMGQNLAAKWKREYPNIKPDIVIPVPFSSNTAALSFAHEIGVRYSEGLYKNPFVGRTFIMPGLKERKKSILQKLSPQETDIKNKDVLLVDDSIVRGTTSKQVVQLVRNAGAKKVYFLSASPPLKYPDFYGIAIPTRAELIAARMSVEEIREYINADILMYQDIPDLVEAVTRRGMHNIDRPSMPYLDGWYVTGDIDEERIKELEGMKDKKTE